MRERMRSVLRFLRMTALGPMTFFGAIRADFHTAGDQLVAGMVGTFLWFMVAMEVLAYV